MSKQLKKYTREEVEQIIAICENIEKKGLDPFTVDVKELLEKLRKMLEENPTLEHYTLDAETVYKIATVIALQNKWITEKARSLFIDSQLISSRLLALDKKTIAQAFIKIWRPIISLEQITVQRLNQGLEHFLSLPPRRDVKMKRGIFSDKEVELARRAIEREREVIEEKMSQLYRELLEKSKMYGEIDYWEFISRENWEETYERAYLTSFLISEGYVEVKRNPLKNELKLIPNEKKVQRKNVSSLVICLGVWR